MEFWSLYGRWEKLATSNFEAYTYIKKFGIQIHFSSKEKITTKKKKKSNRSVLCDCKVGIVGSIIF